MKTDPAIYDAWYYTPRGAWIGTNEFALSMSLLPPPAGMSLLDVGSGSGYFSRCFADAGLRVTGIDPDSRMLQYARAQQGNIPFIKANALALPFSPASFDYVSAITSLCFIQQPQQALAECWRVARRGVLLGLLNRYSFLYRQKRGHGSYYGARWDTHSEVRKWQTDLLPLPARVTYRTGIFFPDAGPVARLAEKILPGIVPWGGFLAVYLSKTT